MTRSCCRSEGPSRRLAPQLSQAAASLLPGAALVLLPKCPICLAAWFAVATGIGISAAAAALARELVIFFFIAALMLVAARIVIGYRRRTRQTASQLPGTA